MPKLLCWPGMKKRPKPYTNSMHYVCSGRRDAELRFWHERIRICQEDGHKHIVIREKVWDSCNVHITFCKYCNTYQEPVYGN